MTPRTAQGFGFVFRVFGGLVFLHAALGDELLNPEFTAKHVVLVLNARGVFQPAFSMLAAPAIAPVIGFLVSYGHLLTGLSLVAGLAVRLSASIGIFLMVTYSLVGMQLPDLQVVGHATALVPIVFLYHIAMYALGVVEFHILVCIVLVYAIVARAGHVMGLDAWATKVPFMARLWVFG